MSCSTYVQYYKECCLKAIASSILYVGFMKRLQLFFMSLVWGTAYTQANLATSENRPELSTDRVFYRFYLLQRLQPVVDLFLHIINEKTLQESDSLRHICSFQEAQLNLFVHPLVKTAVLHICANHDSKALMQLITTLRNYRYIHDDAYVQEVVLVLLMLHENIITTASQANLPSKKVSSANDAYSSLASSDVPLETLLEKLDTLSDELATLHLQQTSSSAWKFSIPCIGLAAGALAWFWHHLGIPS